MILVATSHGGHLELLREVADAFADLPHVWATPRSGQADDLRAGGARVLELPNPHRDPRSLAANVRAAVRILRAVRPSVVLSAGAGVAVPVALLARARGARVVHVETMARVSDLSVTARVLGRVADHVLVQWPEQGVLLPRAEVCRPALLEGVPATRTGAGAGSGGTFVSVGSHRDPFERLLTLAREGVACGVLPGPLVEQSREGAFTRDEMAANIERAAVVLCHGGSGIISGVLRSGRLPLVLPRRAANGEHHDDHQVVMAAKLSALGLVVSLDDVPLAEAVARAAAGPPVDAPLAGRPLREALRDALVRNG